MYNILLEKKNKKKSIKSLIFIDTNGYISIPIVDNLGFRTFLRLRYEKCRSFIFLNN